MSTLTFDSMIRVESHLGSTRSADSVTCNCGATFPAFHPEGHPEPDHFESPGWTVHARRHGDVKAWWALDSDGDRVVMLQVTGVDHVTEAEARKQVEERYGDTEVDTAVAVTIASWWQSPGSMGRAMAALASGAAVNAGDVLVEVSANRRLYTQEGSPEETALDMLGTWLIRVTDDKDRR